MDSTETLERAGRSLLLVDGSALLYRSHFAFLRNPLRNSAGEVTSAVFGVLQAVLPLLDKRKPDCLAVVFDTTAPTFRHRVYAEYKAHRPKMPDDLVCQIPRVREAIRLLGIPIVEQQGVEADDLIGSLAQEAARDGANSVVVTADKDFYQLVGDRILVLAPKGRAAELFTVDRAGVRERFGVDPEQMIDLLALMGDASDNVPGVPGVGEKTAAQLIQRFRTLDALYASISQIARAALREKLLGNEKQARLSQKLVTIRSDLPLDRHWHELVRAPVEYVPLLRLLEDLELRVLARRYREEYVIHRAALAPPPPAEAPTDDPPAMPAPAAGKAPTSTRSRAKEMPAATAVTAGVGQPVGTIFDVLAEEGGPRDAPGGRAPLGHYDVLASAAALESLARERSEERGH